MGRCTTSTDYVKNDKYYYNCSLKLETQRSTRRVQWKYKEILCYKK